MQASLSGFIQVARLIVGLYMLVLASAAYADGMSQEDEASAERAQAVQFCQPRVNHPSILLEDGRLLVAGGMATVNARSDRGIEAKSEIWNPQTGQWQDLANELSFDAEQRVYLSQLKSGRVLFFIVRERGEHEIPEYQVKLWDPLQNQVETISHNIKPRPATDIAVLRDGRVLLINGNDASADLWDSRNNTLQHHEVSELENSRWRILPLRNGQILAVTEFQDGLNAAKKGIEDSTVLLWDTRGDNWREIASLPVPFRSSAALLEMKDRTVQARVAESQFNLPATDKAWIAAEMEVEPALCKDPVAPRAEQVAAASGVAAQPKPAPAKPAAEGEKPWQDEVLKALDDSKWLLLALVIPLLLYASVRKLNAGQQEVFLKYANRLLRVIAFCVFIYLILTALWALGNTMVKGNMIDCGSYQQNSKYEKAPFAELKKFAACVDEKNGVLENLLFYRTRQRIMATPSVPCRFVGEWISTRSFGKYKIRLGDDSRFVAEALQGNQGVVSSGYWAVVGDEILWFYDQGVDLTYEANPILSESMREFTLAEENGEHTVFELQEPVKSSSCKP